MGWVWFASLGRSESEGFVVWQHRRILDWTNCCLTFCFQAEFRRTIMTSTPFFRLVKFEQLAGELRVCQTFGNENQHSDGEKMELSLHFAASYQGLSHLAHYFLHCSNFHFIPNMQPICWLYKRLEYMQKHKG